MGVRAMLKVKWLEQDLSHLALDAPYVSAMTESSLGDTISTVKLANPNMTFSEGDPKSILSGVTWQGSTIYIERHGEAVLDGIVTDGVVSRLDCTLEVQSHFSKSFKSYCDSTLYNTDPATAILHLCRTVHIPESAIDTQSFYPAIEYFRKEGIRINAIADKQYQTPLLDAVNALLEMGCLRAWLDTRLHVVMVPFAPQGEPEVLLRIRAQDILGDIKYGTTPRESEEYSLGHIGDSFGANPAEGSLDGRHSPVRPAKTHAVETWVQSYNANSQWQLVNAQAAHAIGKTKLLQSRRRRTASLTVRDDDAIDLVIGGVYNITPWPGHGWLAGYEKKQGTIDMHFEEALTYA